MIRLPRLSTQSPKTRIAAFIDGFNVYHGLRDKGFSRFYWLDYRALVETFVRDNEELVSVYYFTSRVTKPADAQKRQSTYLDALKARGGVEIIEGHYMHRPMRCPSCGHQWKRPTEKMTDVNVATHLVVGALRRDFDAALLICADADLIPAVRIARSEGVRVIVVSPRGRTSDELVRESDAHLHFNTPTLGQCQLPDNMIGVDGYPLSRPMTWR
jgi:uncharacterized LabA/DUF88 family protein